MHSELHHRSTERRAITIGEGLEGVPRGFRHEGPSPDSLSAGKEAAVETYRDRWISCDDDGIRVRAYYFPWGTKHIGYGSVRGMKRVTMSALRGRARIWGTANFGYWASLDPKRPTKSVAFVLDLGRSVSPFLTPDDPDAFERVVRARTSIEPPGPTEDAPIL